MSTIIKKVEELFRFKMPDKAAMAAMTEKERQELKASFMAAIPSKTEVDQLQPEERQAVIDQVLQTADAMPGSFTEEPMPTAGGPVLVAQGQFFEDFAVSNGPALHVILSSNPSPAKSDELGTTINLGRLKGNEENQNYEIPAGTDLAQYKSIVILCTMFNVVIATATLQ